MLAVVGETRQGRQGRARQPMRIDPSIYAAMDDNGITAAQMFAAMLRSWGEVEGEIYSQAAAETIAHGFDAADVRREIETQARELAASRAQRLEFVRQMLEAGAAHLQ